MMVIFVSECEKKSLQRTRRVLDSFANRIGNRTWQTVITNEGLLAVKSLLRKTASKNTAVSCHWLRSRSRRELIWVVGNKDKFNNEGIVSVNYTEQNCFIGEFIMQEYYANTKKQSLAQHLFSVGFLAYKLIKKITVDEELAKAVFVAGCWHDMGKIDPAFQDWINDKTKKAQIKSIPEEGEHIDKKSGNFTFEKHPRHNEISLLLYYLLDDKSNKERVNTSNKRLIKHTIYWHHAKPIRKEEFKNLETIYKKFTKTLKNNSLDESVNIIHAIVNLINKIGDDSNIKLDSLLPKINFDDFDNETLRDHQLVKYKNYANSDCVSEFAKDVKNNARNSLARASVITADRLVSSISSDELNFYIENNTLEDILDQVLITNRGLKQKIKTCLDDFNVRYPNSERNTAQKQAAEDLADEEINIGVLNGPAGCGKTKISLEWAFNTGVKKIIWICPRVQVCQGLVKDLTSIEYLPNAKIEICTGEFKEIYQNGKKIITPENMSFSGDIVLTTIDQVVNTITSHRNITGLVEYMNAHVIFDEFHEFINMPAFNLLFAELVECKKMQGNKANIILVSATPNYFFIKELLQIETEDIIGIDSFNNSRYQLKFTKYDETSENDDNPLYALQEKNTFIISNTAITAQKSFIKNQANEKAILFHGKYTQKDKKDQFDKVFETFKKAGTKHFDVLRSGPIVQASLNITCNNMITEFTTAENYLQRMGRLDRFGENKTLNIYTALLPDTLPKQSGNCTRFLNKQHCLQSSKAWFDFLKNTITDNPININQVYQIYKNFYKNDQNNQLIEQDLIRSLKESVQVINSKIIDPVDFPNRNKPKDDNVKIKKNSLRGDNCFVQLAVLYIDNNDEQFIDEYACNESNYLTMTVDSIRGYDDSNKDLLGFMAKKHHYIKEKAKKHFKDFILLNEARNFETPIFLSYIPQDLKKVEVQAHPYAIYYAKGHVQPIGAISINKLRGDK